MYFTLCLYSCQVQSKNGTESQQICTKCGIFPTVQVQLMETWSTLSAHSCGSMYFKYKRSFSISMMAVVDARYRFLYVAVGGQGSAEDEKLRCSMYHSLLTWPDRRQQQCTMHTCSTTNASNKLLDTVGIRDHTLWSHSALTAFAQVSAHSITGCQEPEGLLQTALACWSIASEYSEPSFWCNRRLGEGSCPPVHCTTTSAVDLYRQMTMTPRPNETSRTMWRLNTV